MAETTLRIPMDTDVKRQLDAICAGIGMSTTTAVNIFAKALIRERKIPFEIPETDLMPDAVKADEGDANE